MRLWKIRVKHYAPKDSHEAIQGFLLRETEEEVCDFVMTKLNYFSLNDLEKEVEIYSYDEETDCEGQETITKREELLRHHGQIDLDSNDYSDSYYGITHYSWDEVEVFCTGTLAALALLGLFVDKQEDEDDDG